MPERSRSRYRPISEPAMPPAIAPAMIAPCGMNCAVCTAHLRHRNPCPGCRNLQPDTPTHCLSCRIRNCDKLQSGKLDYCFQCYSFPCKTLKTMDKRYLKNYVFSLIENLRAVQRIGVERFVAAEELRWCCAHCGGRVCAHGGICLSCGRGVEV